MPFPHTFNIFFSQLSPLGKVTWKVILTGNSTSICSCVLANLAGSLILSLNLRGASTLTEDPSTDSSLLEGAHSEHCL